jgi:hypothetical protein
MPPHPPNSPRLPGPPRPLGWAAYLGVSWTWCIGMFLPILLWRDFGPWSFLVFALPNIIGAAAMGFVLRDGASERLIVEHALACRCFSLVTLAFNSFLGFWLLVGEFGDAWFWMAVAAIVPPVVFISRRPTAPLLAAVVIWLISIACFAWAFAHGHLRPPPANPAGQLGHTLPASDLLWLAPVCVLGFLLCPYLDLTFHRARQALPAPQAKAAFALGFGGFFALMIAGTLGYAWLFLESPKLFGGATLATLAAAPFVAHLLSQLTFTALVHDLELTPARTALSGWRFGRWELAAMAIVLAALLTARFGPTLGGLEPFEVVYRGFMSFYGLVFPAYVWLCVIPRRGAPIARPTRGTLVLFALAITLAAPAFYLGFIARETWWLGPGVAIVLLARLALPLTARPPRA